LDAEKNGTLGLGTIALVASDRPGVYALERAQKTSVPTIVVQPDSTMLKDKCRQEHSNSLLALAESYNIDLIVLAGFLSILAGNILQAYSGRIINLHPSLLPKFGGEGMYGERVHRAVLDAGECESGCTVHLVDSGTDTGSILLQRRVPVLPNDTPYSLAQRIHKEEHIAIVEAVRMMINKLCNMISKEVL
jgi:phosphoribosylglycinamide formyltransferase-1